MLKLCNVILSYRYSDEVSSYMPKSILKQAQSIDLKKILEEKQSKNEINYI